MLLFLLLVLSAFAFAEATTQDCFTQEAPKHFWEQRSYIDSNGYIDKEFMYDYYSYSFDDTAQNDAWNASLMNGGDFLSLLPASEQPGFAQIAQELDKIDLERNSSAYFAESAHNTSSTAQLAGASIFDLFEQAPFLGGSIAVVRKFVALDYAYSYGPYFWGALLGSSQIFTDTNSAGRLAAAKVDEQRTILEEAGAGEDGYFGKAKNSYLGAQNLLSGVGFCGRQERGANAVLDYFNDSPALAHTLPPSLSTYLNYTIGKGNGSSLAVLASDYLALKQAYADMDAEYEASRASAATELAFLKSSIANAKGQRLDLLTDLPAQNASGAASAGTVSSGLVPELQFSEGKVADIEAMISDAQKLRYGNAQGYLADAIAESDDAIAAAKSQDGSVALIISNAQNYAALEKDAAQAAIDSADATLAQPLPAGSADAGYQAKGELDSARALFSAAQGKPTIGEQYQGYQYAMKYAQEAQDLFKGGVERPMQDKATQALTDLQKFLDSAEKDGANVDYERAALADDRATLANANSSGAYEIIMEDAAQLRLSVWQQLELKYSGLDAEYASLSEEVLAIREVDAHFLPGFDSVKGAFVDGKLDIDSEVGGLKALQSQMDSLDAQVQAAAPQELSDILSKNAKASSTHGQFTLGQPSEYRVDIYTTNTAPISLGKAVSFSVATDMPVYSSDNHSGDDITDAYPDGKNSVISVPSVAAGQEFHFVFEKQDMPAQITSSAHSCSEAGDDGAQETDTVGFFASRSLDSLIASADAPDGTGSAEMTYRGISCPASLSSSENGLEAGGTLGSVASGQNSLAFQFDVANPFEVSVLNRTEQDLGGGNEKVEYIAEISQQALECNKAEVSLPEPYTGVESFSVSPLGTESASSRGPVETGQSSVLGFSFSQLRTGSPQYFAVSFNIRNSTQALAQAIQNAETTAILYNRTSDLQAVDEAKRLAALNETGNALAVLAEVQGAQGKISSLDYQRFAAENSSAGELLASALGMQTQLEGQGLTAAGAQLATLVSALQAGEAKSATYVEAGQYKQADDALMSAASAFQTGLSSLSWKSSSQAADDYAKARKTALGSHADELSEIENQVALSQRQYSSGNLLESFLSSSLAESGLDALQAGFAQDNSDAKGAVMRISSDFAGLKNQADAELAAYSAQYSALTTQTKRTMPITPADAQKAIQDAESGMEKAAGAKEATADTLSAANKSYGSLAAALEQMRGGLSSLQGTANASLGVARIALEEAKQKASPDDAADVAAMQKELDNASDLLSNSLYADSLASSGRALSAASLFVQNKAGASQVDPKAIALGAVSLLFIAGAAYYFWQGREKKEKPGKKTEIPKADDTLL